MGGLRCRGVEDMNRTLIVVADFCLLGPSQPVAMGSQVGPPRMAPSDWSPRRMQLGGSRDVIKFHWFLDGGLGPCVNKRCRRTAFCRPQALNELGDRFCRF
jgi:hypothetical protein